MWCIWKKDMFVYLLWLEFSMLVDLSVIDKKPNFEIVWFVAKLMDEEWS